MPSDPKFHRQSPVHRPRGRGKKSAAGIGLAILAAVYTFLAPIANERFGWNLPDLKNGRQATVASAPENARSNDSGSVLDRNGSQNQTVQASNNDDLQYGILREVSTNRFMSPAGLLYTPGSAEGHRLKHLERHTVDDPGRPGSHGVFDDGMEGALKSIDLAYERAQNNQNTTKKTDDGRTIYTVTMGGRVGFVGGRDGNRRRKPMAKRIRLVLEGNRVITAYPM